MAKLITFGVPVFNGERHLPAALDALLAQDHPNLEFVISDNASTDKTEEICRAFAARDARVRYHRQSTNIGPVANSQAVFDLSRGEYFAWAGHHDLWDRRFASACGAALDAHPDAVLAYPLMRSIDVDGALLPHSDPTIDTTGLATSDRVIHLLRDYPVCAVYGLIKADALRAVTTVHGVGLHRPLDHAYPDVLLLLKLALAGSFALVREELYYNRMMHRRKMTEQEQVERLSPGRGKYGRWSRLNLFRDLITAIRDSGLETAERVRLTALLLRYWGFGYSRTYLYQLDRFRVLSRAKHALNALAGRAR